MTLSFNRRLHLSKFDKLFTGELRTFGWVPEDQCVEGPDQGLNRSSTPSGVLACAYPHDIDPQTHSVKVFLISISHETEHEGKTSEFDLLTRPSSWPHLNAELQLRTTKVNHLNISGTRFFGENPTTNLKPDGQKGLKNGVFMSFPRILAAPKF